jgi:hypothetical membrane protein
MTIHDDNVLRSSDGRRLGYAEYNAQRLLAISGIIAPIFYASLAITMGLIKTGYSHRTMMMSILGGVGGLRGFVFNIGVTLTGLLLIAFAIGLHRGISEGRGSKVGPLLIVLAGAGMMGAGIFHCDSGCANVLSRTFTGIMHTVSAFIAGLCLAISPFVVFPRIRRDRLWGNLKWYTLATGILANIPGLIFWISLATIRIPAWEGLIQRLGLAIPLLWVEVMSIQLLRLSMRYS